MIAEVEIHNVVKFCLKGIREDWIANGSTESDTILYHLFNSSEQEDFGKYKWFEQAKEIFIGRDSDDPKFLDTRIFFDKERARIPTIHVMVSGENKGADGIGMDQGYIEEQVIGGDQRPVLNRQFAIDLNLVITSDNAFETVIIYHTIKCMLISISTHIQLRGFINPVISGRDIVLNQEIAPSGIFTRVINFRASYELNVPEVVVNKIIQSVWIQMNKVNGQDIDPPIGPKLTV